jgi:hypothetical protein
MYEMLLRWNGIDMPAFLDLDAGFRHPQNIIEGLIHSPFLKKTATTCFTTAQQLLKLEGGSVDLIKPLSVSL